MDTQRPRPKLWWVGLGLVLAGMAILGWVGWQFFGTNWLSQRTHSQIVSQVEREWADADPDAEAGADPVKIDQGEVAALIRIPRFGNDYVVPILEGLSDQVLASGYGHFEESAGPGEDGNYALAAHRVTHGEPLRNMPKLQIGDQIIVETRTMTYTYELTTGGDDLEVPFTSGWVVDPLPTNPREGGVQPVQTKTQGQKLITLTTCAELFHTDNRMIAFGVLINSEPRS